jgi:hypothetical protein
LSVNREITLDGKAFLQLTADERATIFIQTSKLRQGKLSLEEFNRSVVGLKKSYRFTFERERQWAIERLNETFGDVNTFEVNGQRIFDNIKLLEIERLDHVFKTTGNHYDEDRIEFAKIVTEKVQCQDVAEYKASTEYFLRVLDDEAKKGKVSWKKKER